MTSLLLVLLLQAAPPVADAEKLAARNDAETLFLQYGSAAPSDYSEADRARLSKALLKAARSARKDAVIALGLTERAVLLTKTADGLALMAELEAGMDQRGAAARHLDEALELEPKNAKALASRAELAMAERDFALAASLYDRAKAAGVKGAAASAAKARAEQAKLDRERSDLDRAEEGIKQRVADAARNATKDWIRQVEKEERETTQKRHLAPDGKREQSLAHFTFSYSAGERGLSEIMALDSKVEKLLDKAYEFVTDHLRYKLEKKVPVELLTRAEFAQKYAGQSLSRAAGFWNGHKIVINGGAEVNQRWAATMVHELTHAVVTEIAVNDRAVPRWLNEGLAENVELWAEGREGKMDPGTRRALAAMREKGSLPKLAELEPIYLRLGDDAHIAYAMGAEAVRLLLSHKDYPEMLEMLREIGKGKPAAAALEWHFERMDQLESELDSSLR